VVKVDLELDPAWRRAMFRGLNLTVITRCCSKRLRCKFFRRRPRGRRDI